jgi:hypothetical protein
MFAPQDHVDQGTLTTNFLHQAGAQAPSNAHVERLGQVLLTYNFYNRELGGFWCTCSATLFIHSRQVMFKACQISVHLSMSSWAGTKR